MDSLAHLNNLAHHLIAVLPYHGLPRSLFTFNLFGLNLELRLYTLLLLLGCALPLFFYPRFVREGWLPLTRRDVFALTAYTTIGVIVGGRLGYVLFYNLDRYLNDPIRILQLWHGGNSFHGGLIGVFIGFTLFARAKNLSPYPFYDAGGIVGPWALFLGRLGNFLNGELYGRESSLPFAMVFPTKDGGMTTPRHPSQLYEALGEGLLLGLALYAWHRHTLNTGKRNTGERNTGQHTHVERTHGVIGAAFLIGYGIIRFFIEFVREPDAHLGFVAGPLTMGQLLCLATAATGLVMALFARHAARHAARHTTHATHAAAHITTVTTHAAAKKTNANSASVDAPRGKSAKKLTQPQRRR